MRHITDGTSPAAARFLAGALLVIFMIASSGVSQAAQIIPSLGLTKATDSNAGDGNLFGGVALRVPIVPYLSAEGGIMYRDESYFNDDLKVRMWPVTASLWLTPTPMLYAGAGLGWYRTTYDFESSLPFEDKTTNTVGVHLGGGLAVPLATALGLDLNGRYIFMQKEDDLQVPTELDPDFWSMSLGLAIKF